MAAVDLRPDPSNPRCRRGTVVPILPIITPLIFLYILLCIVLYAG